MKQVVLNKGTYSRQELSHADYLADRQHVSSHWLGTLTTKGLTPAHLHHQLYNDVPRETFALIRGRVLHTALLEPELLRKEYVTLDREVEQYNKNSNTYKRAKSEMLEVCAANGQSLISNELMDLGDAIRTSVTRSKTAKEILDNSISEHTLVYQDHEVVSSKMRADIVYRDAMVIDAKSAACASESAFKRAIAQFGYDIQAAHYSTGAELEWDIKDYGWLVFEPEPPYEVAFWSADDELLQTGYAKRAKGMDILAHCLTNDDWPGYPDRFMPIELPTWAVRDSDV